VTGVLDEYRNLRLVQERGEKAVQIRRGEKGEMLLQSRPAFEGKTPVDQKGGKDVPTNSLYPKSGGWRRLLLTGGS